MSWHTNNAYTRAPEQRALDTPMHVHTYVRGKGARQACTIEKKRRLQDLRQSTAATFSRRFSLTLGNI